MRCLLAVLVAVTVVPLDAAAGTCRYYDAADQVPPPWFGNVPVEAVVCELDAITHNRFHLTACCPPGVTCRASTQYGSSLRTWVRCYDTRQNPPRCLNTLTRASSQCIGGQAYPKGIGAITTCVEACDVGADARNRYFMPVPAEDLPPDWPFLVPTDTVPGAALHALYLKLQEAHRGVVEENGPNLPAQLATLDLASLSLFTADDAFLDGERSRGDAALLTARNLIDFATDFVPGVSLAKDIISITTGVNPITGEELGDVERSLMLAGLLLPSAVSGTSKGLARVGKALARAEHNPAVAALAGRLRTSLTHADDVLKRLAPDALGCVTP